MCFSKTHAVLGALLLSLAATNAAADMYGRFYNVSFANMNIHSTNPNISASLPIVQVASGLYLTEYLSFKVEFAKSVSSDSGYSEIDYNILGYGLLWYYDLNIAMDSYIAIGLEDEVPLSKNVYFFAGVSYATISYDIYENLEVSDGFAKESACNTVYDCKNYSESGSGGVFNVGFQFTSSKNAFFRVEYKKYPKLEITGLKHTFFGTTVFNPTLVGVSYQKVF